MKFGHFCLPTYFPDIDGSPGRLMHQWLDLLTESEELGFDSLWANEHHFDPYGGIIPSPPMMLAALSQRTKRVRLGTSIVVLPLHSPIEIAEQLAMVDLMSHGRLEFGIGRGFVEFDYDRLHVPRQDSNDRMREQLEIILKAWRGEPFSHDGRFYHYKDIEVWPKGEQQRLPVWVSCSRTPSSFAWAGERGFNVLTVAYHSVQNLIANTKIYREAWDKTGHPRGQWNLATHFHCVLSESKSEARAIARNAWRRYMESTNHTFERLEASATGPGAAARRKLTDDLLDTDRMVEELRQIAGTPEECVSQLERAQDLLGFSQVDCTFFFGGVTFEQAQRSQRLFAREVMPKLRGRAPRLAA